MVLSPLPSLHNLHLQFGVFVASTPRLVVFSLSDVICSHVHIVAKSTYLLRLVCPSVRMTAFIISAPTGRIFANFDIGGFY